MNKEKTLWLKNRWAKYYGKCKHCKGDDCRFKKSYEIDGVNYEKCNGATFEFHNPTVDNLDDYLNLFREFYSSNRK